ncbi:TnsD family Tn7-like transposition protein [Vibrio parahaemolyticus]|nr:TnsD family Tn7-like transposition protein [Vibrio parahaemolyticus]
MLCLPNALPDELLFSRMIRYLMVSGEPTSKFLLTVYGSPKASVHPYLTAGLSNLAELAYEDSDSLLYQQTLAPVFIHCLPSHAAEIYSGLLSHDNYTAIRASQLFCVREREPLSLKYCSQCVKSDIHEYGISYWHRSHQIPGVESCSKHPIWLVHVELPDRIRTNIGLPAVTKFYGKSSQPSFELADYANKFLLANEESYPEISVEFYRERLRELGYVTKKNRFRRRLLSAEFYRFILQLKYPSDALLPKTAVDHKYLSYLLCENASQQPFKHILFSYWLNKAEPIKYGCEPPEFFQMECSNQKKSECLTLLRKGRSIASISKDIGKSRCFVKAVALSAKVNTQLKPTKLTPLVCQTAIELAQKGFHRKEIARRLSISSGSVEMLISATKGLVQWRKQCKHESKRRRYQLQILRYRQYYPQAIRREVKSDCNAAFFWLYLHEREWLEENLPEATPPHPCPRANKP